MTELQQQETSDHGVLKIPKGRVVVGIGSLVLFLPVLTYFGQHVWESVQSHERRITISESQNEAIVRELGELESKISALANKENSFEIQIRGDISKIWIELSQIKGRLPEDFPPPEIMRRIERIEDRILALERKVRGE